MLANGFIFCHVPDGVMVLLMPSAPRRAATSAHRLAVICHDADVYRIDNAALALARISTARYGVDAQNDQYRAAAIIAAN